MCFVVISDMGQCLQAIEKVTLPNASKKWDLLEKSTIVQPETGEKPKKPAFKRTAK